MQQHTTNESLAIDQDLFEKNLFSDEDLYSDKEIYTILHHLPFEECITINPHQRIYTSKPTRCENNMFKHRL